MGRERDVLWGLMESHLLCNVQLTSSALLEHIFSGEFEFPGEIERNTVDFLENGGSDAFNRLALSLVKSFYLSGYAPEGHLLVTAYLLRAGTLPLKEACRIAQLDASNFGLMSEEARDLVRLAETIDEEESIGANRIDSDDVLSASFEDYFNAWKERNRAS